MSTARNRIVSVALAVCLLLGMTLHLPGPMEVSAALPQPGNSAVGQPYDGMDFDALARSGIYFGAYRHVTNATWYNDGYRVNQRESTPTPILWRVMGEEMTNGQGDGNLTLLSEYVLDFAKFNPKENNYNNIYAGSSIQLFLAGDFLDSFTDTEKNTDTMVPVDVVTTNYDLDEVNTIAVNHPYGSTAPGQPAYLMWGLWDGNDTDSLFWSANGVFSDLDADNINNSIYWLGTGANLDLGLATIKGGGSPVGYWLRSPYTVGNQSRASGLGLYIEPDYPSTYSDNVYIPYGIRPAFQLNPSTILFASKIVAGGIEENGETGSNSDYSAVNPGGESNYKLTIVDSNLSINNLDAPSAPGLAGNGTETLTVAPGGTLGLTGSINAGNLAYKIVDRSSGKIVGYGKGDATSITINGTANVTGTGDLDENGDYTLYVWAQRNNDDRSHEGSEPLYFQMNVLNNDATLLSIAEQPIHAGDEDGTKIQPITATISLDKDVEKIEKNDIETNDINATVDLYPDSGFMQDVTEISLTPGTDTHLYIKVVAQDTTTELYYDITAKRGEFPTLAITEHKTTLQMGNESNGTEVAAANAINFSGTVTYSIEGTALPAGLGIDTDDGTITVIDADALEETPKDTYTAKAVHGTEEATATVEITILAADAPPPKPQGPKVYEDTLTVTKGDTATFQISLGHSGNQAAQADISSDDESIATATPPRITGTTTDTVTVRGESKGSTTITVTFSGGDLATPTDAAVKVNVTDKGGNPGEPDKPNPPVTDPDGGNGGGTSSASGSRSRSSSSSSRGGAIAAKATIPASAFSWDGRTLTIDDDRVSVLGLTNVLWDDVETKAYNAYQGSVIIRFEQDFIAAQSPGEHIVRVEFLNHSGETAVTVGEIGTGGTVGDTGAPGNNNYNPATGGYPTAGTGTAGHPNTGDGRSVWPTLVYGCIGGAALVIGEKLKIVS